MSDRQLIADLLSALEYHTEQTRPIEFSKVAIEAAREHLRKPEQPAQQEPLTDEPPKRWAVFCGICRKEWSVPYQHPGKSVCADCETAHGITKGGAQ